MPSAFRFKRAGAGCKFIRTAALPAFDSWTYMAWVMFRSSSGGTDLNTALRFGPNGSGAMYVFGENSGLSLIFENGNLHSGSTVSLNKWYHIAVTSTPNAGNCDLRLYLDGVLDITVTGVAAVSMATMTIGESFTNDPMDGDVGAPKLFNRPLTAGEIEVESTYALPLAMGGCIGAYPIPNGYDMAGYDPFYARSAMGLGPTGPNNNNFTYELQDFSGYPGANEISFNNNSGNVDDIDMVLGPPIPFAPPKARSHLLRHIASATTAYTLPVANGSYTLTGQAVALRVARALAVAQGSYALAGQNVGLKRGYPLVAGLGSYALTGQSVALRAARRITVAAGSYALSGQTVTLLFGRRLPLVAGAFTLTGHDVSLLYSGSGKILTAGLGSYALSGQAVSLRVGRALALANGAYNLAGQAVGLKFGRRLVLVAGAFSLAGQAVSLRRGLALSAGVGAFVVNGQSITLRVARVLRLAPGVYALVGEDIGFGGSVAVILGPRPFSLTARSHQTMLIARSHATSLDRR